MPVSPFEGISNALLAILEMLESLRAELRAINSRLDRMERRP